MPQLKFIASQIAAAERKYGANFFATLESLASQVSVNNLAFLFEAGGGSSSEFDETFRAGADAVVTAIVDGLGDSGFLDANIVAEAKKALAQSKQIAISPSTGATTNPAPSKSD